MCRAPIRPRCRSRSEPPRVGAGEKLPPIFCQWEMPPRRAPASANRLLPARLLPARFPMRGAMLHTLRPAGTPGDLWDQPGPPAVTSEVVVRQTVEEIPAAMAAIPLVHHRLLR